MEIGTGIFLGCSVVGLIYLFLKTRNSWKWKKIILRAVLVPLILLAILGLGIFVRDSWNERPKLITSFKDISLNEKISDVIFRNGDFEKISSSDPTDPEYEYKKDNLSLSVANDKVVKILYLCKEDYEYESINGIGCSDLGDKVLEKFGKKLRVQCSKHNDSKLDQLVRVYDTVSYGVRYLMYQNKVKGFLITEPSKLETFTGANWIKCK